MSMLLLGGIFASFTLAWLCCYAAVVDRAGGLLRRPRVRRTFDAVTGIALMAFGGRLATQPRYPPGNGLPTGRSGPQPAFFAFLALGSFGGSVAV
jgi:hypothetical protein